MLKRYTLGEALRDRFFLTGGTIIGIADVLL